MIGIAAFLTHILPFLAAIATARLIQSRYPDGWLVGLTETFIVFVAGQVLLFVACLALSARWFRRNRPELAWSFTAGWGLGLVTWLTIAVFAT